jgi:hypothetical protein
MEAQMTILENLKGPFKASFESSLLARYLALQGVKDIEHSRREIERRAGRAEQARQIHLRLAALAPGSCAQTGGDRRSPARWGPIRASAPEHVCDAACGVDFDARCPVWATPDQKGRARHAGGDFA